MAVSDEPRRSGRATKGQHKSLENPEDSTPKPKKVGRSKGSRKTNDPEPSDDGDEDGETEDEVVRCVCGDNSEEIVGRMFIACDTCHVWQHNACMGVTQDEPQPDSYFCEQCRPEEHQELLDAIREGRQIWLEREKNSRSRRKSVKKGKGKGGRQSRVSEVRSEDTEGPVAGTPAASIKQETSNKRRLEEDQGDTHDADANVSDAPSDPVSRRISGTGKRRKSSAVVHQNGNNGAVDVQTALVEIDQLPKERQNVAEALKKLLTDGINGRSKKGHFRIPDGHTASSLGAHHASRIEYALYMNYSDGAERTPQYAQQFRQILANIKKNVSLLDRVLEESLSADELAKMSSQDMASEELQKERAQLKEEADKQAVMLREEEKPRVRRTHKGEEYVDEGEQGAATSVFTGQPVRRRESAADVEMADAGSPTGQILEGPAAASPVTRGPRQSIDASRPTPSHGRRKSSQQFDINNVWAKTQQSPDAEQRQQQPHRQSTDVVQQDAQKQQTTDADVDRLLADDNDDTYSLSYYGSSDHSIVWRGKLVQPGIAELTMTGRFIAGNDFSRYVKWEDFLPKTIEIEGRLEKSKADEYLCGLQWSKKSDVTVIALTPYEDREAFDKVFEYFASRGRYAVGRHGHGMSDVVKDLYLSPVEIGAKPPPHIELLFSCILEFPLRERMLFATFVINKPTSWENADAQAAAAAETAGQDANTLPPHLRQHVSTNGPSGSPLASQTPAYSPRQNTGFTPMDTGFPPNPYSAQYPPPNRSEQPPSQYQHQYSQGYPQPGQHPQQQQQQQQHEAGQQPQGRLISASDPLVRMILGPYANAPVVGQVLSASGGQVCEHILRNMRSLFEKDPRAREDINFFATLLDG